MGKYEMLPLEWKEFLIDLIKREKQIPCLIEFIYFIITFKFIFPDILVKEFNSKNEFLDYIKKLDIMNKDLWQSIILRKLFPFTINDLLLEYLLTEEKWWIYIRDNSINIYELSDIHEFLEEPKQRKKTGSFFTPENQVKLLCHYALFFFFKNRNDLITDDETIYQIIFLKNYPKDLSNDLLYKFNDYLLKIKILDPSCGSGTFLFEMSEIIASLILKNPLNKQKPLEETNKLLENVLLNLYGFDINRNSIRIAKIVLMRKYFLLFSSNRELKENFILFLSRLNLHQQDFLTITPPISKDIDICIGNPPYVRHHGIFEAEIDRKERKRDLSYKFQSFFPEVDIKWDFKADLYIYFWINAIATVPPQSIITFIVSRAWLSSRYTTPIFKLLKHYFKIDLILESPFEVWKKADVRTHIFFGHKELYNTSSKETTFLIWKKTFEKLLTSKEYILDNLANKPVIFNTNDTKIEIRSLEYNTHRITNISNYIPFLSSEKETFPLLRLDYFEMAPFILLDVLLEKKHKFSLLKDLGKVEMGSTTGANKIFYLNQKIIEEWSIPEKHLHKMTKSPKDWKTINEIYKDKIKYFLYVLEKPLNSSSPQLSHYLNTHQEMIMERPYFKNRTTENWFRVPLIKPVILIPNMIYKRSFVVQNQNFHIDKQWIGFWPKDDNWNVILLAFLNSSLGILLREIQGTKTLGMGSLKLSLKEVENLLVIDPRKIPSNTISKLEKLITQLGDFKVENILNSRTKYTDERTSSYYTVRDKIDQVILIDYLECEPETMKTVKQILNFEVNWRLAKEYDLLKEN